jgi:hypothetical protein
MCVCVCVCPLQRQKEKFYFQRFHTLCEHVSKAFQPFPVMFRGTFLEVSRPPKCLRGVGPIGKYALSVPMTL